MESCDPVGTPIEIKDKLGLDQNGTPIDATKYRSMIGALMYLTSSRPDIVHATCLCAQYQAKPTEKHLKEVKSIFRYLWGTVNTGLWYTKDFGFELTGFSDADYAGCKDTFKSTSEAEYVSLSACCAQVLWMRTQLTDYGFHFNKILIYCDSKSAIAISCNPIIMVIVIPPDHVDEVPVVEPNQHDDVPFVSEPVLVDENEDLEENEFEEEENPQEEEDDMEIDIEEDENEPKLTYPYEEVDPLNPLPPVSESELDDKIEVENPIEHEDKTVLASVHEMASISRQLCGREMAHALVEKKGKAKDKFYGKLILELGNENERVERDLYWTRVRAHEL
uniref:Copia protein n=1 Tax=Tanacetum cinerariifolium TaxID=118510 RepID=A0A699JG04_TANCI|nr:hypothetical protein [Tanacetum cinerariifolium]